MLVGGTISKITERELGFIHVSTTPEHCFTYCRHHVLPSYRYINIQENSSSAWSQSSQLWLTSSEEPTHGYPNVIIDKFRS